MVKALFFLIISAFSIIIFAQEKKTIRAEKIDVVPKIDGILDEAFWSSLNPATGFIEYDPYNGDKPLFQSEVKVAYDHSAIYIGAFLYDSAPDSIFREFGKRDDDNANADIFGLSICPFSDGLNMFEFQVTASGMQIDKKTSSGSEDFSWNAVWQSDVQILDNGWSVEIKIPYSAIRFPNKPEQNWQIEFWRQIRRNREWSTWTYIDKEKGNVVSQFGNLTGMKDIKPPIRLSATPYVSGYLSKKQEEDDWGYSFNGGMDIKYGINESFTVDMTLIPDFGQVQSDDKVLNLTPYETYFGENRPFFTEGTELFSKGDIFYSRRIGAEPINYSAVTEGMLIDKDIVENPSQTRLINATKVSGRTNKGLGIGLFNAMTSETQATYADSAGNVHSIITQPFTNYNMVVFDQNLPNNSSVALMSTNMFFSGYLSDVTGTTLSLNNKKNSYGINGDFFVSSKKISDSYLKSGYRYSFGASKLSGKITGGYSFSALDSLFDPNDMGYLAKNNEINHSFSVGYHKYQPFWRLNNWHNTLYLSYSTLYRPLTYTTSSFGFQSRAITKKYLFAMLEAYINPMGDHDYYEPRVPGRVYKSPGYIYSNFWVSPDYRKKFLVDLSGGFSHRLTENTYGIWTGLSPRIRVNSHMLLVLSFNYSLQKNSKGFAFTYTPDSIFFGKRNVNTITNTISTNYIFNNKSSLSFRLRHYWSDVKYFQYYVLNSDGFLENANITSAGQNFSYNAFTIDLNYTWQFAPGSELTIVWKNTMDKLLFMGDYDPEFNYFKSLDLMINLPQTNSFSLKILYYLDYRYIHKG